MSARYCWRSPLRAVSVEHLALSLSPSLLVPFPPAHPHQPDGVSISPSCAASRGGVCGLPLSHPHTKMICICSLILLRVYQTPSFLNCLFILHETSLASPLSLLKPLSLRGAAFTLLLCALLFRTTTNTRFGLPCPQCFPPSCFLPVPLLVRIKPRGASFLVLFLSLLSQFFFLVHSRNMMEGCV